MKEIVTQNLWDVLVTLNIKYRIIVMVEWCILMIHGLVYDFMVANLSCCCWEYYIDVEIIMLTDECLELCWLIDFLMMMWDVVEMMFYVKIMRFTFIWVVGVMIARIQGVGLYC